MKILQLCHKMPYPVFDGGSYSLLSTALGLASQGMEIHVLAVNSPKNRVEINNFPDNIPEHIHLHPVYVDTRIKPFEAVRYLFTQHSYFIARFRSGLFRNKLIQLLNRENFDIVQMEHLYLTDYIETIRSHSDARIILRPQNVEYQVWERVLEERVNPFLKYYLKMEVPKLRRTEINTVPMLDGILAIAPHDEDLFRSIAPKVPVGVVPIGFDFDKTMEFDRENQYNHFPAFTTLAPWTGHPISRG